MQNWGPAQLKQVNKQMIKWKAEGQNWSCKKEFGTYSLVNEGRDTNALWPTVFTLSQVKRLQKRHYLYVKVMKCICALLCTGKSVFEPSLSLDLRLRYHRSRIEICLWISRLIGITSKARFTNQTYLCLGWRRCVNVTSLQ